jgi:RimJ/RimL family protein N-acetyltransferase
LRYAIIYKKATEKNMQVQKATLDQIDEILRIYEGARAFMRENGNPSQWQGGYPYPDVVKDDIEKSQLYVLCEGAELYGVFAFIKEDDPDYARIDGAWLNSRPYAAIHRVASAGKRTGIVAACVEYCLTQINNLKIDTHEDNIPMQKSLERIGFSRCGKVNIARAGERIAYQLYKPESN